MDTNQPYLHYMDKSGDYMEWDNQPFPYSFSADYLTDLSPSSPGMPTNNNDSSLNDEFMQYLDHPYISDVVPSPRQQQQQPSPMVEEEDDDDDSLDCLIATPHQFYFPSFDLAKDDGASFFNFHSQNQRRKQYTNKDTMISMTPSTSSSSSKSSISSSSLPSNLLDDYASAIPRSYVSLSDVNAFVAKADSIKHSSSAQKSISLNHQHWETASPTFSSPSSPDESGSSGASSPSSFDNDKLMIKLPKYQSPTFATLDAYLPAGQNLQIELDDINDMYYDEDEYDEDEEENDESDDDYGYIRLRRSQSAPHTLKRKHKIKKQKFLAIKKGRNVDKACNHCKRSHLRCDDMRPCRRCISTGKIGCKDVQHKPRGRPKIHKK